MPVLNKGRSLTVSTTGASANRLQFEDVPVGEVWILAGQSNLVFALKIITAGRKHSSAAKSPRCSSWRCAASFGIRASPMPGRGSKMVTLKPSVPSTRAGTGALGTRRCLSSSFNCRAGNQNNRKMIGPPSERHQSLQWCGCSRAARRRLTP